MNNPPEATEIAAQTRKADERIGEMEVENDGTRTHDDELEQKQEDLTVVQCALRKEENNAFAQKNAELVRAGSQVQQQDEQAMQKETDAARREDYEKELLQKRIASLEQESSQHASIRDQYETLKTLYEDALRQMEALKEKLEAAVVRADNAETEVMSLKYQTRRLEDPHYKGKVVDPSLPKCCFYYSHDSVTKVYALPQGGPELDAFVADLFKGGEKLCFDVSAPAKLIPTIIQAFKVRSARVNFRPLRFSSGEWTAAAKRSVRPCPFCVAVLEQSNDIIPVPHVTDRYHFQNAHTGQQMTIEFSYRYHHPKNVYEEPEEYWARTSTVVSVRIRVDDELRCRPVLPNPPQRQLELPNQGDLLLAVFDFASRDDLDAEQLSCTFWRDVVSNASGTLALRPLRHVTISFDNVIIQRAPIVEEIPADSFDTSWKQWVSNYNRRPFRPDDFPLIMSSAMAHLAGTFRATSVSSNIFGRLETITTSLQLLVDMGVKDFVLRIEDDRLVPLILDNELLLRVERLHLEIETCRDDDFPITPHEISDVQELCHEHLRKAVGCHLSFLLLVPYAVFSCDNVIDRFLTASRSDDFSMPLSIRMEFGYCDSQRPLKPTHCTHPTLRDIKIPWKVLPRHYNTSNYDVYHFRNERTNEWLTVCLGNCAEGRMDFVFLQKGRIMASVEDIDKMEPFPYPWMMHYDD
ncbi:hypothetical protein AAVH_09628 [Aphelenchoides avenae]|nr:hypothetical protein AAVH_09628 [Aphelenchus avenae]